MKRVFALVTAAAMLLTLLSGIGVFAEEENATEFYSAFEDFGNTTSFNLTYPETYKDGVLTGDWGITTNSGLSFVLSDQNFISEKDSTLCQKLIAKDASNSLFVRGVDGGSNHRTKNNNVMIKFKKFTSGTARISFAVKITRHLQEGTLPAFGALVDSDNPGTPISKMKLASGKKSGKTSNTIKNGSLKHDSVVLTNILTEDNPAPDDTTQWHQVVYDIDATARKYSFSVDGKQYGPFGYATESGDVDGLYFGGASGNAWYNSAYYIDNVSVCENPENNTRTVNFYKGEELIETRPVAFGSSTTFPTLETPEGTYFSGWYGDANGETTVDLSVITKDTDVYAIFKPYIIHEDFGNTTSFRIEDNAIKTDSGFIFKPESGCSGVMSVEDGTFFMDGRDKTTGNTLNIGFNDITSGKANISFRFKIDKQLNNNNTAVFGFLNNINQHIRAKNNKLYFGTTGGIVNEPYDRVELASDSNWHKVEYKIDADALTYYFVFDGTSYGPYTLSAGAVNNIKFDGFSSAPSNMSYHLDNLCVILDPENNGGNVTVKYVDEDGSEIASETVTIGEAAANIPDMSGSEKVFVGWFTDTERSCRADLNCITKDTTVYAGYLTENSVEPNRVAVKTSDVTQATIDETIRDDSLAAASFNGRTYLYAIDSNSNLVVYDVTDENSVLKVGSYEYSLGRCLVAEGNYLYCANNTALSVIALGSDGLPTGIVSTIYVINQINKFEIFDGLLFVSTNSGLVVYDISNAPTITKAATAIEESMAQASVFKVSDKRYRISAIAREPYTKQDGKAASTVRLMIYDLINAPSGWVSNCLFNGIPDYSAVNAWPCYGIYGENETVPNYFGFSECGGGYINYAGSDLVRYTAYLSNTEGVGNNDFIIDISNPKNPKVVTMRERKAVASGTGFSFSGRSIRIDDSCVIEYAHFGTEALFMDYSDKKYPRTIKIYNDLGGYAGTALGGKAYTAGAGFIRITDIYDNSGTFYVAPIYASDTDGSVMSEVRSGVVNGKSYIYNPGGERTVYLIASLYGLGDNTIKDTRIYPFTLKTGFNEIQQTIELTELAYYNAYTTYLRMYLWDSMDTIKPLTESVKIDAVTVDGVEFDIWISDDTEVVQGIFIMDRHGLGETFRSTDTLRNFCAKNNWAIISFEDGAGQELTGFHDLDRAGNLIIEQINSFAGSTGHSELANAPIATFGHSSATLFAERFASWIPERCFAAVGFRVHNRFVFDTELLTVPFMVNQGEVDAYGNNDNQLALSQSFNAKGGLVNYTLDPEASHGMNNWQTLSIIYPFLEEAYAARVPEGVDFKTTKPTLNTIDRTTGWLGDISNCYDYIMNCKPNGKPFEPGEVKEEVKEYSIKPYSAGDPANDSWLFNEEYAEKWLEFVTTGVVSGVEY